MFENGDINNDNDAQNGNEELEIINVNNTKEKEKEKDFPLETDEIEVFSPESLQNLLVNDDTKEAENESIKKKESVNNIDESNNKDIEKVENKTKNRKGEILNFEDLMERNKHYADIILDLENNITTFFNESYDYSNILRDSLNNYPSYNIFLNRQQ